MKKKGIIILSVVILTLIIIAGILWIKMPKFPVKYVGTCGVDDYINGNCIKEYPKGTDNIPEFSQDDWVFYVIKNKKQELSWSKEYSNEELLKIAQEELGRIKEHVNKYPNSSVAYKKQIVRIQSFIDILSGM